MYRKLKLDIVDKQGHVITAHHFFFNAEPDNTLCLSIGDTFYHLDSSGKIIKNEMVGETKEQIRGFDDIIY